jgi:hypothetical protein
VLWCGGSPGYWFLAFRPEGNADEDALSLDIADGGDCCRGVEVLWVAEEVRDPEL